MNRKQRFVSYVDRINDNDHMGLYFQKHEWHHDNSNLWEVVFKYFVWRASNSSFLEHQLRIKHFVVPKE